MFHYVKISNTYVKYLVSHRGFQIRSYLRWLHFATISAIFIISCLWWFWKTWFHLSFRLLNLYLSNIWKISRKYNGKIIIERMSLCWKRYTKKNYIEIGLFYLKIRCIFLFLKRKFMFNFCKGFERLVFRFCDSILRSNELPWEIKTNQEDSKNEFSL